MQYSNLKDEDHEEEMTNKVTKKITITTEVLLRKKEFSWFLVLILVLVIAGSVIFFCVPTGGKLFSIHLPVMLSGVIIVRQEQEQEQEHQLVHREPTRSCSTLTKAINTTKFLWLTVSG